MIEIVHGNLFESGAEALVNPVNCVGVMGRGLAAQFRRRYPNMFREYQALCRSGMMRIGRVQVHALDTADRAGRPERYVLNFPTKHHWRYPARIDYIRQGLPDLALNIEVLGLSSIAIPALGAGLGGLDWTEVQPLVVQALEPLEDTRVLLYPPR